MQGVGVWFLVGEGPTLLSNVPKTKRERREDCTTKWFSFTYTYVYIDKKIQSVSRSVVSDSLWLHGLQPTRPFCLWNSPGKNTGVGCCCLIAKLCLTLCDLMDCSSPGFSVYGILQARILEWVAILYCRGSFQPGIKPAFPISPALAGKFFITEPS